MPEADKEGDRNTKIMATIVRGYAEGISHAKWKAKLRGAEQAITTNRGALVCISTTMFSQGDVQWITMPYEGSIVRELKILSAIICMILVDTTSLAKIITWESLQKLKCIGRSLAPSY